MSNNPDPFPEVSAQFAAVSAQMRQRKVDALQKMRRIVEEQKRVTYTPEEWAKIVLSIQIDRTQCTPEQRIAALRETAEDFRCSGDAEMAAAFNELATEAETILNN